MGATCLWLNTVLFESHPVSAYLDRLSIIGQNPKVAGAFDDKFYTNSILRDVGCDVVDEKIIDLQQTEQTAPFPIVIKPIRGRGSQGVSVVTNFDEFVSSRTEFLNGGFGTRAIIEPYLQGKEWTITVMPPGDYVIDEFNETKQKAWALPPVERFNHLEGIAPYSGTVAVSRNSRLVSGNELETSKTKKLLENCVRAFHAINSRAAIRIDCRQDDCGNWKMFDLNLKPNMTGGERPGRDGQDSLSAMAASGIGWRYTDLLMNLAKNAWKQ